jgi:hypothetical protein
MTFISQRCCSLCTADTGWRIMNGSNGRSVESIITEALVERELCAGDAPAWTPAQPLPLSARRHVG